MMNPTPSIVGTGLFALDVILRQDGSTTSPTLGGSAGNVLYILGALGWSSTPVGVLGNDGAGSTVSNDFRSIAVDTRFLVKTEGRSTPVIYQHQLAHDHSATHRFTFACPVCGERRRPFWDCDDRLEAVRSELPPANVFFLDRPTKLGVTLAEQYAAAGSLVVFEPSAIGDDLDLFARAIRSAHIVKYAEDRLDELNGFELSEVAVEIQTRGADGLRFRVNSLGDDWANLTAYDLPYMQDTSGAGDWCTAGLIFELFRQNSGYQVKLSDREFIKEALAFGQALSTLNCMTEGARGLLLARSASDIIQFAQELLETRLQTLSFDASYAACKVSESRLSFWMNKFACENHLFDSRGHSTHCCSTT